MKYIRSYKIFENVNDIIDDVNDILLELNDLGFKCKAYDSGELPPGVIKNIPIGYKIVKTHDVLIVSFSKDNPGFDWDDVKEVYERIKSYLENNGWTDESDLQNKLKNREERNKIMGAGKLLYVTSKFIKPI
jgi:hypothetical protein